MPGTRELTTGTVLTSKCWPVLNGKLVTLNGLLVLLSALQQYPSGTNKQTNTLSAANIPRNLFILKDNLCYNWTNNCKHFVRTTVMFQYANSYMFRPIRSIIRSAELHNTMVQSFSHPRHKELCVQTYRPLQLLCICPFL